MSHSFDALVLLISIPSEISVLSYSNIYNLYKYSSKKTLDDSIYHITDLKITVEL